MKEAIFQSEQKFNLVYKILHRRSQFQMPLVGVVGEKDVSEREREKKTIFSYVKYTVSDLMKRSMAILLNPMKNFSCINKILANKVTLEFEFCAKIFICLLLVRKLS